MVIKAPTTSQRPCSERVFILLLRMLTSSPHLIIITFLIAKICFPDYRLWYTGFEGSINVLCFYSMCPARTRYWLTGLPKDTAAPEIFLVSSHCIYCAIFPILIPSEQFSGSLKAGFELSTLGMKDC